MPCWCCYVVSWYGASSYKMSLDLDIEYSPLPSCGSEMSFFCYVVFFLICIYHDAVYWTSWLTLMYTITFALCSEFVWKSAKCYWLLSWHSLLKWLLHAVCVCLCRALTFVYPYGATLNVAKPAIAVLSSGSVSYPLNRPVCAFYGLKVSDDVSHLCQLLMSDPLTCLVVIVSMLCVDRVAEESWPCWDHVICSVISISTRKKTAKYS